MSDDRDAILYKEINRQEEEIASLRAEVAEVERRAQRHQERADTLYRERIGEVWIWQGDDEDHPESLSCPVLMQADMVREFIALRAQVDLLTSEVQKNGPLALEVLSLRAQLAEVKAKLNSEYRASIGEVWHWQGDGYDHLETTTCPVLIQPEQLKAFLDHIEALEGALTRIKDGESEVAGLAPEFYGHGMEIAAKVLSSPDLAKAEARGRSRNDQ